MVPNRLDTLYSMYILVYIYSADPTAVPAQVPGQLLAVSRPVRKAFCLLIPTCLSLSRPFVGFLWQYLTVLHPIGSIPTETLQNARQKNKAKQGKTVPNMGWRQNQTQGKKTKQNVTMVWWSGKPFKTPLKGPSDQAKACRFPYLFKKP